MEEPEEALALADRICSGLTTAHAAAEATLDRAEACASFGAVCVLDAELAPRQAEAIGAGATHRSRRSDRPPLRVPFQMKDSDAGAARLARLAA